MDLQVGKRNVDLRFWRDGERTRWEVLKGDRDAVGRRGCASRSDLVAEGDVASGSVASSRAG